MCDLNKIATLIYLITKIQALTATYLPINNNKNPNNKNGQGSK